jgi:mono/diheme cytochrome c family protein
MNATLFYVFGISLTVLAVAVAAIGLRSDRFPPSRAVMVLGTGLFVVLFAGTAVFGWLHAEDEQDHRAEELAHAAEENVAEGNETEAQEEVGEDVPEETTEASADGAALFESAGCTGCHALADAGSTATTGPPLDGALEGQDEAFIEQSIVDPNAEIAKGYPPDVMPQTYGEQLSPEELSALVSYLAEATGGG